MEILVKYIGIRNSFLSSEVSERKERKMEKKEIIFVITLITVVVCLIVLPRWYYQTRNPVDTIDLIYAIFTAAAVEIGILGGLIISLRK